MKILLLIVLLPIAAFGRYEYETTTDMGSHFSEIQEFKESYIAYYTKNGWELHTMQILVESDSRLLLNTVWMRLKKEKK